MLTQLQFMRNLLRSIIWENNPICLLSNKLWDLFILPCLIALDVLFSEARALIRASLVDFPKEYLGLALFETSPKRTAKSARSTDLRKRLL